MHTGMAGTHTPTCELRVDARLLAGVRSEGAGERACGGGTKQPNMEATKRCTRPVRRCALGKAMALQGRQ